MSVPTLESSPIEEAARVAATLPNRALEVEAGRTVPADLVAELRAAGLFGLMMPASLGGLEADPLTIVKVVEVLSHGDAATGWTVLIGQGAGYLAWLDPNAAAEILHNAPVPLVTGSMAPLGTAVDAGAGAVRLTGRWPYASGCQLADYLVVGYRSGEGPPRFALLPRAAVTVDDTWQVAGMRGTGSHDIEFSGVRVPHRFTFDPYGPARVDAPLYRLPYMSYLLVAMAGFPLGAAQRIVDEYRQIVLVKRNTERTLLAETPIVQAEIARCETAVGAARAFVYEAVSQVWAETQHRVASRQARARLTGSVQHAMRVALDVADSAMRACGASQLYNRAPLQRYFRDVQTAAQHIAFGLETQRRVGSVLLGQDVADFLV
ncbi:acyl-CoA dehydrogenase family protein [Solwaraspora sp. WMMD406]|uniref:acyl-CoA dehydrogenase family protein n=1 Tax=Solwaraspora sp. WMMD406 TaxID=3016095 RepID=UPI0024175775|nr:acyl-CoA dehydrogenase family protein [Solwaraspora sp. WMMD406]MDG4763531.1 acyl-CoA dehydrogenase family protein [Solwaraspora sp. WMMD406]